MRDLLRYVVGALLIIGAFLSVRYVQNRFDRSDEKNAVEVVRDFHPAGANRALDALIAESHGVLRSDLRWSGEMASGCFGYVRVACEVPERDGLEGRVYRFDVDINRVAIHPADSRARTLLAGYERHQR